MNVMNYTRKIQDFCTHAHTNMEMLQTELND